MLWIVVLIGVIGAEAQKDSPCPDIFRYETTATTEEEFSKKWIGIITLGTDDDELQGIWLHISLDEPASLLLNWFGHATTQNNKDFTIQNPSYELKAGTPVLVKLQVQYNAAAGPPSLSKIRLNGRTICASSVVQKTTTAAIPIIRKSVQMITTERSDEFKTTKPITTTTTTAPIIEEIDNTQSEFFTGDLNILTKEKKPSRLQTVITDTIECGTIAKKGTPLITNAMPSKEGNWPWHIALYTYDGLQQRYICGGSLIGKKHVLTAAHCVTRPDTSTPSKPDGFLIHLGRTNLRKFGKGTQERQVDTISVHPKYNPTFYQEDLAVLKLSRDADYTDYVRPVCLWSKGIDATVTGKLGTVIGWGYDQTNKISEALQETKMPVVNKLKCINSNWQIFSRYTTPNTFCAGFRNGTSVCNGDSGGGMFFAKNENVEDKVWEIRGTVSVSVALQRIYCDPFNFVLFTDLAYYLDWIKAKLAE